MQNRIRRALSYALFPLLLAFLLAAAMNHGILTAVALEQPACCGMEEHFHTAACYWDDLLVCGQKAHTHNERCYLLLLEDNNVNWLLAEVGADSEKSLTGVITRAVALGMRGTAEIADLTTLDSEKIIALNTAIGEDNSAPAVVLNERLSTAAAYAAPAQNGGNALLSELPASGSQTVASNGANTGDEPVALAATDELTLRYDINWNYSYYNSLFGNNAHTAPTVEGNSTYSATLTAGSTETIRAPSTTEVTVDFPLQNGNSSRPRLVRFKGGSVSGSNTLLQSGEVYTYAQLSGYASGGTVTLTAEWEEVARGYTINFFIKWNSVHDGATSSDHYTPVLYVCEYANNRENISSNTTAEEYAADSEIRAKAAAGDLSSFPTDEYTFKILESYMDKLSVDGEAVTVEQLNEHGYTILWYGLAYNYGDGNYHIDGRLVRKVGSIRVKKTFSGNADAIAAVEGGSYTITAASKDKTLALNLKEYDADYNQNGYQSHDSGTHTYTWEIPNVTYGEKWTLTENDYTAKINGQSVNPYMEYTVEDALSGGQSARGEYKDSVTVTGQTYDQTIDKDKVLTVSFHNIYPGTDSFILAKEDADTGELLTGATFSLSQNGKLLHFTENNGVCSAVSEGGVTELHCTGGLKEIEIKGLSFENGNITVAELKSPEGYSALGGNVVLTKRSDGSIGIASTAVGARMENNVLTIDNTAGRTSVTVEKHWGSAADAREITLNLLANGQEVSTLFPTLSGSFNGVTLNADNGYTHTWDDLPAYADGGQVTWSARETRIGSERANADGSFDNWTVVYSTPATTDTTVRLTVTNIKKDGNALTLRKVNENGDLLPNVDFRLELLMADGTVDESFTAQTGSTNEQGLLSFAGLPFGRYRLTETKSPTGYAGGKVDFTLNTDRSITVNSGDASAEGLVLTVKNLPDEPLPNTGGVGTERYLHGGLLLLAAGCLLWSNTHRRGKEGQETS